MNIKTMLEHPPPRLEVDTERIAVSGAGVKTGTFTVQNTGAGVITGEVLSNSPLITFSPSSFSAKKQAVSYSADLSSLLPDEIIKTSAVLITDGGERIIPIILKAQPAVLTARTADGGARLASLKDLAKLAKKTPAEAARVFTSKGFADWLGGTGYPHFELYQKLSVSKNTPRALDDFLSFNRLKKKAAITGVAAPGRLKINPYTNAAVTGEMVITRSGWGYLDTEITKQTDAPWLELEKNRLSDADFGEDNAATLAFSVAPAKTQKKYASETVIIGGLSAVITVFALPPFSAKCSREYCSPQTGGRIEITNNTQEPLEIEVSSTEQAVRFSQTRHTINPGAYGLAFEIRLGVRQMQYTLQRVPYLPAMLSITAPKYGYTKRLRTIIEV